MNGKERSRNKNVIRACENKFNEVIQRRGAIAQLARVRPWHGRGPGFESL